MREPFVGLSEFLLSYLNLYPRTQSHFLFLFCFGNQRASPQSFVPNYDKLSSLCQRIIVPTSKNEGMRKNPNHRVPAVAAPANADAGYSRLHIAPLDPQLLKVIVPSSVLPHAKNISFHSLQSFPDRPYGFVDLPPADAEKIKKKLNGAVLRGTKIRIEPARLDDMPTPSYDAVMEPAVKPKKSKSDKKDKKRKRGQEEITAVELEEGRKVKRGWTVTPEEAEAKKKKEKADEKQLAKSKRKEDKKRKKKDPESKYSEGPECLVKTQLPPNKLDLADDIAGGGKKKKGKKHDVVVHEFEKNTKFASFLKATQPAATSGGAEATFVKGKGWIKDDGTLVEEVKSTRPTTIPKLQIATRRARAQSAADSDTSSSSGSSSEDEPDSDAAPELSPYSIRQLKITPHPNSSVEGDKSAKVSAEEPDSARPKSASSARSLTIQIPPATPTPASAKVHPLEVLYKRQQDDKASTSKQSAGSEPFAFFGGDNDDEDEGTDNAQGRQGSTSPGGNSDGDHLIPSQGLQAPMTPFTKQDLEWRNTRSAAPTPDTAHPSRISRIWYPRGGEDDNLEDVEEDQGEDEGHSSAGQGDTAEGEDGGEGSTNPSTDFQKWFWEHRGDLNRSWKKRRKMSAKEKRYRENRARTDKAI